ncbi:MAG: hypothetical protein ACM3QY_14795, partial [Candidatus Levyibacteriota bacterium]
MNALAYYRRRVARAVARMRARGYPLLPALLRHLPRVLLLRSYRRLAQGINRSRVFRPANERSLRHMHAADRAHAAGGHFYVIVMPGMLHYLLPCLALVPEGVRVRLVANGARRWERRVVARAFPRFPMCRLRALPATSLTHGDVITLLLATNIANFGLLDHDCYVFDPRVFDDLAPGPGQCLTAVYGGVSQTTGLSYPETYFLFLNTPALRDICARYGVDARNYHAIPEHLRSVVGRVGVGNGVFVKDHVTFFDTLHLMLTLAIAEGFDIRFLQWVDHGSIAHVGGTSWKTPETKELIECYVDQRFLEFV